MVEFEADDGLASAAHIASRDPRVEKVCIWTPDKDLGQCVVDDRVVQFDRRANTIRNADGVRAKFGVDPERIPDYLALVGDSADGFPGVPGQGAVGAKRLIQKYGPIESFPPNVLGAHHQDALLFKTLATLRTDAPLFEDVDELEWTGPRHEFEAMAVRLGAERVLQRATAHAATLRG
jgi:5'-3' exonuclease